MAWASLTRLRLRSWRFLPGFGWYAFRSSTQVRKAAGYVTGAVLNDREWTFWTLTVWESQAAMRSYMTSGAHKQAMPKLMEWCDEASIAHWEQQGTEMVSWEEADRRMRAAGRASKVRMPSAAHAALQYREPRTTSGRVLPKE